METAQRDGQPRSVGGPQGRRTASMPAIRSCTASAPFLHPSIRLSVRPFLRPFLHPSNYPVLPDRLIALHRIYEERVALKAQQSRPWFKR
eukprot:310678-Chlamydomonas_euryale.AAC.2